MNEIEQAYGKLKEGMHITGYAFERSCTTLTWLLQENRWKQCGKGFKEINGFLDSIRMEGDLKFAAEQRKKVAAMIKALQPKASNRAIGKAVGASHTQIAKDLGKKLPRKGKNASQNNGGGGNNLPLSGADAAKVAARAERVKERQTKVDDRVAKVAFDAGKLGLFSLILADPPWDDDFGANRRSTENHYPTMSIEDIRALPVSDIAHAQAMLFLWATSPMLESALEVVRAWGFEYRTQIVWVKPSIGLGQYVRQRHELLLVCRRGDHPAPNAMLLPNSVIEAPRGKHSEKPEIFLEVIERMYPEATKIELFRRGSPRKAWTAWGAEVQSEAIAEAAE